MSRLYRRRPPVVVRGGDQTSAFQIAVRIFRRSSNRGLKHQVGHEPLPYSWSSSSDRTEPTSSRRGSCAAWLARSFGRRNRRGAAHDRTERAREDGQQGRDSLFRAMSVARAAGVSNVTADGVVQKSADGVTSMPGLLNYFFGVNRRRPAGLCRPARESALRRESGRSRDSRAGDLGRIEYRAIRRRGSWKVWPVPAVA